MVREWRRLQKIDDVTYKGECDSEHPEAPIFGGHVLAQALSAAYFTTTDGFYVHSVHCYFIRRGDEGTPITFKVKKVRDGRNFSIRYVEAEQHGKIIHLAEFSFQRLSSVTDKFTMTPQFPEGILPPEGLENNIAGRNRLIARGYDSRDLRGQVTERMAPCVELRPVDINMYLKGTDGVNEKQFVWIKYKNPVDHEDYMLRHASLVYLSDMGLVVTGSLCHKETRFKLMTSLDHTAWFHQYEFDINDWVLYEQECQNNSNHRSLVSGRLWSRDGRLLLSTSQEALIYKSVDSKL